MNNIATNKNNVRRKFFGFGDKTSKSILVLFMPSVSLAIAILRHLSLALDSLTHLRSSPVTHTHLMLLIPHLMLALLILDGPIPLI
jgi:hypothetical protein